MSLNADLLRASFALAITRRADLTERFYETLFERHPSLRSLFRRTPPAAQARMLGQALASVQYDENELKRRMKAQVDEAIKSDRIKPSEAMRLLDDYERGLKGYTYLGS